MSHASALMVMSPTGKGPRTRSFTARDVSTSIRTGTARASLCIRRTVSTPSTVHGTTTTTSLRERLGDARVQGPLTNGHATVFPNFSYLPVNGSIRIWHPKGPDKMEVWAWTVLDKSWPEEVREAQRLYNLRTFGPSGSSSRTTARTGARSRPSRTASSPTACRSTTRWVWVPSRGRPARRPDLRALLRRRWAFVLRALATLMNTPAWHEGQQHGEPVTEGIRVAALDEIAEGEGLAVSKDVTGTEDDIAILRDEDGGCGRSTTPARTRLHPSPKAGSRTVTSSAHSTRRDSA